MNQQNKQITVQQISNAFNGFIIFLMIFLGLLNQLIVKPILLEWRIRYPTGFISGVFFLIGFLFMTLGFAKWAFKHHLNNGFKYAHLHSKVSRKLSRALLDAGVFVPHTWFGKDVAQLPDIQLTFSSDLRTGKMIIENWIKFDKKFEDVRLSSALGKYIVDYSYKTNNQNSYVFLLVDSSIDKRLTFDSEQEFTRHSEKISKYQFFIDRDLRLPLHHYLLIGQTGTGKTYGIYSLVLQGLAKPIRYNYYFADPKGSSLATLGTKISPDTTGTEIPEIINLLSNFVDKMASRKKEMAKLLQQKLDSDYRDFNLEPYIFIFDEFAAFETVVQTLPKKDRDKISSMLSQIVLQGRQLGFFIWIAMQQASSTQLPTYIRENIPFKVVLGNAEKQTIVTAFGPGVEVPKSLLKIGEGFYTFPNLADTPRKCAFSKLNFDILSAAVNVKERGCCKHPRSTPKRGD